MGTFNPETGEFLPDPDAACAGCDLLQAQLDAAKADVAYLQTDLMTYIRRNGALKAELKKQRMQSTEMDLARAVFRYWIVRLKKNPKMTKFGAKRQKAVIGILQEYEPAYVCRAIDGLAETVYKGHDDLELVCRDETKVEYYYNLAEKRNMPTLITSQWLDEFQRALPQGEF